MNDTSLIETERLLGDLIAFPSISADSNMDLIGYVADYLDGHGARVMISEDETGTKANIFATLGPDADGGIILSGHTDVVPVADQDWTSDPFQMTARDGRLFGRGTCDMKGFIAATLAMAPEFASRAQTRPVHFAFTYDEEVGCLGAQALVADLVASGLRPDIAIIGEPTEMRVIEGHKGCRETTTHFTGCEGHGSAPDLGVNAAEYAARYVGRLLELRETLKSRAPEDSRFEPPWSTLSIGKISGGTAHNVIAGKAHVEWDFREVQESDGSFLDQEITAYVDQVLRPAMQAVDPSADIVTEVISDIAGLMPMDDNAAVALIRDLTGANGADLVAFGTEAGLFQRAGVNAVVCGPGSIREAHKPDEYIARDQLGACLDMLSRLSERLS